MSLQNVLTIDPGINTGWAFWNGTRIPKVGEFRADYKLKTIEGRLQDLYFKLNDSDISWSKVHAVHIEGVRIYRSSAVSMIAASKGDLSFLSYIIGIYCALFTIKNIVFSILSPSWKGSLNYTQLALWVEKSNGLRYKSEHILAAVGMGLKIGGEL